SGATFTKIADPATLPSALASDAAYSPDGSFLAVAESTPRKLTIYSVSGATFTKVSDPATLPAGDAITVDWSPNGTYLTVTSISSPFLQTYTHSGTTFIKIADPSTLPSATHGAAYSPSGAYLAVGTTAQSPLFIP